MSIYITEYTTEEIHLEFLTISTKNSLVKVCFLYRLNPFSLYIIIVYFRVHVQEIWFVIFYAHVVH